MKGRDYFNKIKQNLKDLNIQRDIQKSAINHFEKGNKKEALDMINEYQGSQMNIMLYIMKCKLHYTLNDIKNCESTAKEIISKFVKENHIIIVPFLCVCIFYYFNFHLIYLFFYFIHFFLITEISAILSVPAYRFR